MGKKKQLKDLRAALKGLSKLGMEVDEKPEAPKPPSRLEAAMTRVPPGRAAYIQAMNLAEVIAQLGPKDIDELYWYAVELSAIEDSSLSDILKVTIGGSIAQTLRMCFEEYVTRGAWPREWPHGTRRAMAQEREDAKAAKAGVVVVVEPSEGPVTVEARPARRQIPEEPLATPADEAAIPVDIDYMQKAIEVLKAEGKAEVTPEDVMLMAAQIREIEQGTSTAGTAEAPA